MDPSPFSISDAIDRQNRKMIDFTASPSRRI